MGYGVNASFFWKTWGKVSAMFNQIKDIMRKEKRKKTAAPQASIKVWIYSGSVRRKRNTRLLSRTSNKGWILKR